MPINHPYVYYDYKEEYVTDPGIRGLPVGRVGAEAQAVNLHSAITYRVVTYTIIRQGKHPVPPPPKPKAGEVLVEARTFPENPVIQGNTGAARIRGYYKFLVKKAIHPENLPIVATAVELKDNHDGGKLVYTTAVN